MGIFLNKKPDELELMKINSRIEFINDRYKWICSTDDLDAFITGTNLMNEDIKFVLKFKTKYPNYIKKSNLSILSKISKEKMFVERKFIDRYIMAIERKLLDYTTERGKTNNFNKKVDLLRYYADQLEPETLVYFNSQLSERFPQYFK